MKNLKGKETNFSYLFSSYKLFLYYSYLLRRSSLEVATLHFYLFSENTVFLLVPTSFLS